MYLPRLALLALLGGCPHAAALVDGPLGEAPGIDADPGHPLPALPLATSGRFIVDATGQRFKLASANWYGAEEKDYVVAGLERAPLPAIAKLVRSLGFNAVRLPWSNELLELDPIVDDAAIAANPQLHGLHAMQVLDAVIAALVHEGLVVILDNHASSAGWCCSLTDDNQLWYNAAYPEASWLADWRAIAARYRDQPGVVGADLRNELRGSAAWGGGDPSVDWSAAALRGGNAVLGVNPALLVFVEGINYSLDFTAVTSRLQLAVPNRLVWSPHDYAFDHNGIVSYDGAQPALKTQLGDHWGFLLAQGKPYTAPVWVGEFGTCNTAATCIDDTVLPTAQQNTGGFWFAGFRRYLADADIDWSYWPLNGTEANGGVAGRAFGKTETYGVLDPSWTHGSLPELVTALQGAQPATQGP